MTDDEAADDESLLDVSAGTQIKKSLLTAFKNYEIITGFVSPHVTHFTPRPRLLSWPGLVLSCPTQHGGPKTFQLPQLSIFTERQSVKTPATQPLGRSLPLTPNNASGLLKSISMTKVTGDKPPAASLH